MTEGEVNSLQDIAKAHGGSLTINPQTGLPEAGFLSSILPMVAGAGLMAMGVPSPLLAAGIVGGGSMLLNPRQSLGQGLMTGLSAYGGANLGQALAQQGMATAASKQLTADAAKTAAAEGIAFDPAQYQKMAASQLMPDQIAKQAGTDFMGRAGNMGTGIASLGQEGGMSRFVGNLGGPVSAMKTGASLATPFLVESDNRTVPVPQVDRDPGQQYDYYPGTALPTPSADPYGREKTYYSGFFRPRTTTAANGGMMGWPAGESVIKMASGGISDLRYNLGGYSDGGRLLRGPGDGVSDSIPATIANKQPARLADGEFVVPARIVSELGNGSTEAGARKLYAMMDRVQKARGNTVGKGKVAKNSRADKYLPA
jgi:hypothetical protein